MHDSSRGKRIDRFEVIDLLGKGATGTVYRARDVVAGREVALKVLLHTRLEDRHRARFQREGELTAALDHPGIVRVHSAGELASGAPFLAYELVEGARTLGDACEAEPDLARKVGWVRDAARALGFAHAREIVHRDVKPDNLLVDARGQLKVADFGAAWAKGAERLTVTGAAIGTPYFMCPEQLVGAGLPATPAWDVWSLGVTLYTVLTGEYPFDAPGLELLTMRVVASDPDAPSAKNAAVSPALEAVCLACLAKAPADRYADGEALAADLDRALAGQPVLARRPPRVGRLARRRALLFTLPVLAVAVLLIAAAITAWSAPAPPELVTPKRTARPPRPPRPAERPRAEPVAPRPPSAPVGVTPMGQATWDLAQNDDVLAMRLLAKFYKEGIEGYPRNLEEAVGWYERGVALGDSTCMNDLAHEIRAGRGVRSDPVRMAALFERAAELGDPSALKHIALCYESGDGVPIDWARSMAYYSRHFETSGVDDDFPRVHAAGMFRSGGPGLPKDVARAVKLYEESAGAGNKDAMVELGLMLRDGVDVPRDLTRARALLAEAVKLGSDRAAYVLQRLPAE